MRSLLPSRTATSPARQALIDHKKDTVNLILDKIPDIKMTIGQLADLIGMSYEWTRIRIMKSPDRLHKIGERYLIPKGVAEEFVHSIFD